MASTIRLYQRPRWLVLLLSLASGGSYVLVWTHFVLDEMRQNGHPRMPSEYWTFSAAAALLGGLGMMFLPSIPGADVVSSGLVLLAYACLTVCWILMGRYSWNHLPQIGRRESILMAVGPLIVLAWISMAMVFGDRLLGSASPSDPNQLVQHVLWSMFILVGLPLVALCGWIVWVQGLLNRYWRSRIPGVPTDIAA